MPRRRELADHEVSCSFVKLAPLLQSLVSRIERLEGKAPPATLQIFIEHIAGRKMCFTVSPSDTILSLKQQLCEREGIPTDQIRLRRQGKVYNNDLTIADYGIQMHTLINMDLARAENNNDHAP